MHENARGKWGVLALLFVAGALNYADRTAISAVFPLLQRDLAISSVGLAAIGSFFLWSYAFTSPFAGVIADRRSRSRLVAISLGLWSLVTGLTGLVTQTEQLYVLRLLLGISECLYLPAALGLIADYHEQDTRATALGAHSAALSIGMVAGGTVAGFLGDSFGWRPCFFLLGGAGLVLSAFAAVWLRDPKAHSAVEREPLGVTVRSLVGVSTYFIVLTEAALIAITSWVFANWLPLYFRETYGLTLTAAGFSGTFALTAGIMVGVTLGGYLSDRFGGGKVRRRLLLQGTFYLISAPVLLIFLAKPAVAVLGAAIFLHGALRAFGSVNELPLLCELLPSHRRSTAIGFMNAMNTFIGGSGVLLSGLAKQAGGLTQVFVSLAVVVAIAGLACLAGYKWVLPRDLHQKAGSNA